MPRLQPAYAKAYAPALAALREIRSPASPQGRRINAAEAGKLLAGVDAAIDVAWKLYGRGRLTEREAFIELPARLAWTLEKKLTARDFLYRREFARVDARLTELIDFDPSALECGEF